MKQLLKNAQPIDFEHLGYQTRLECDDEERARTICGLHLHSYEHELQPELSRLDSEITRSKHHAAALHSGLYDRRVPVNDAAMLTHTLTCRILSVLAVLAGIACFAGNMTTWYLFGANILLTLPIAIAVTALPVIIGHFAFEQIIVKYKGLQTAVIVAAALLCFAGVFRFAQARLLMVDKASVSAAPNSYVDGATEDAPPKEDTKAQENAEAKIRQMFGEAVLMMMIAAELMFGYLVGVLTKKHTDEDYRAWRTLKAMHKAVTDMEEQIAQVLASIAIAKRRCMAGMLRAENLRTKRHVAYHRTLGGILVFAVLCSKGSFAQKIEHYEGILIDTSGSISQNGTTNDLFREYLLSTRKLLLTEPANARVWVSTIATDSFGGVREVLKGWTPDARGVFTDDLTRARRQLASTFEMKSSRLSPVTAGTDIIGGLWHLKALVESTPNTESATKTIWIFSDMMNETATFPMPVLLDSGPEQMLERAKANNLLVPLNGYKVYIYGASPGGLTPQAWATVKQFWTLYFSAAGAELVAYSAECNVER